MADNAIGSASLHLSTNAADLEKGLNAARGNIEKFISATKAGFRALDKAIKATVVGAVLGVGVKLLGLFKDIGGEVNRIANIGRTAERLGTSVSSFSSLMASTRLDAQSLERAMQGVAQQSQRAAFAQARGGRPGGGSGGRSGQGFAAIGLDSGGIAALAGQDMTTQFTTLVREISSIQNVAQRTQAAVRLFGESGVAVSEAISRGFDGTIQSAQRMGLVLSDDDVAAARRAQLAQAETARILAGMRQQVAVLLAPVLETLNAGWVAFWSLVQPVFRNVLDGLKGIWSVIQAVAAELAGGAGLGGFLAEVKEFWQNFTTNIDEVKEVTLSVFRWIGGAIGWLIDNLLRLGAAWAEYVAAPIYSILGAVLNKFLEFARGFKTSFVDVVLDGVQKVLDAQTAVASLDPTGLLGRGAARAQRAFNGIRGDINSTFDRATNTVGDIARGMDTAAQSTRGFAQQLRESANVGESIDAFFDRVGDRMRRPGQEMGRALADAITNEMRQRAAQIRDSMRPAVETMRRSVTEAQNLFQHGLINERELGGQMATALATAESALKIGPAKFATAALAGSKEAGQAIYSRGVDRVPDTQERIREIAARQLAVAELQERQGREIIAALRQNPDIVAM